MGDIFVLNLDSNVSLRFKQDRDSGTHASTVWSSGVALSKWLWSQGVKVVKNGSKCCDVGSGLGPVGCTMAKLGAKVTLTDVNLPNVLQGLKENAEWNEVDVNVEPLDWTWSSHELGTFDLVTTADTLFDINLASHLAKTLYSLSTSSTQIYVAYEKRDPMVIEEFLRQVKLLNMSIKKIPTSKLFSPADKQDLEEVEIIRLKK